MLVRKIKIEDKFKESPKSPTINNHQVSKRVIPQDIDEANFISHKGKFDSTTANNLSFPSKLLDGQKSATNDLNEERPSSPDSLEKPTKTSVKPTVSLQGDNWNFSVLNAINEDFGHGDSPIENAEVSEYELRSPVRAMTHQQKLKYMAQKNKSESNAARWGEGNNQNQEEANQKPFEILIETQRESDKWIV